MAARFCGPPLHIRFQPALTAHRGRLLSGGDRGQPVHAGSFLRRREIIFETELLDSRSLLETVWLHELAHFAWVRLGNARRNSWKAYLRSERSQGEAGWSAEWRKAALQQHSGRAWTEYVCESFCDSAALAWGTRVPAECTLAPRWREARKHWFARSLPGSIAI